MTGGASADIVYPGSNNFAQWWDNLRFQANISGRANSTVTIGVSADGAFVTPSVSVTLDSQGNGSYHRRTRWPHAAGVKYDVVMRCFWSSTWYDCAGDSARTDQYLHGNVKVHRARVFNTTSASYTTTWSGTGISGIFDNASSGTPTSNSSTIDGIYGQCGPLQANGIDKTQFRAEGVSTISTPASCSDLSTEFANCKSCTNICSNVQNCLDVYATAAGQTNSDDVYIYVIDEIGCQQGSITVGAFATNFNGKRQIVITDQLGPDTAINTAVPLLAHEIGHHFPIGGHTNNPGDNCDQGTNYAVKNLICEDLGRLLVDTAQCDPIHSSNVFTDRN